MQDELKYDSKKSDLGKSFIDKLFDDKLLHGSFTEDMRKLRESDEKFKKIMKERYQRDTKKRSISASKANNALKKDPIRKTFDSDNIEKFRKAKKGDVLKFEGEMYTVCYIHTAKFTYDGKASSTPIRQYVNIRNPKTGDVKSIAVGRDYPCELY